LIRILGVGSPYGDDQAGWLVIDALAGMGIQGVELVKLDRPGAALVGQLDSANRVVLIDAMQGGGEPGTIRRFDRNDWPDFAQGLSSHGLGVAEALALAKALDALPADLTLYGIEISSAEAGDEPCQAIRTAASTLAERIASAPG